MNTTITNNQEQSFVEAPTPSVDGENPQVSAQDGLAQHETLVEGGKIQKPTKEYKPIYSDEDKAELENVTKVGEKELLRLLSYSSCMVTPYGNQNVILDLTAFIRQGGIVVTPAVNRAHGKDLLSTGESIRTYGAQRPLLIITAKMARAAGMKIVRFPSDKSTEPIPEDALVIIDGNGRMAYFLSLNESERPQLYATFIVKDSLGYYNPRKTMEVINTERVMWKTQDMVQKRQLEEGEQAHEGWNLINELVNKRGYNYQAACQSATLANDRIKKRDVTEGDAKIIFSHFMSAKTIHEALVAKFGEGDDKTLKTKEFTKEVSILWNKLQRKGGDDTATKQFIKFIDGLKDTKVKEIKDAKNVKGGLKKDDIRKSILNEQFNQFIGKENIEID